MAPKVGETRKKPNGKTEKWTGKRWVEQTQPLKNVGNLINKAKLFIKNKNNPNKSHYDIAKENQSKKPNPKQNEINQVNKNIKNARGWNKEQLIKKKKHLEKFGKSKTWSNAYGAEGGGKPSTGDTLKSKTKKKRLTAREKLVAKNVARHGQAHVDKLKAKNVDFKKMKRKEMSKEEFIKKYPKSITAQKHHGLRK